MGPLRGPLRIAIVGHQWGSFPDPVERVQATAHRFGGPANAPLCLSLQRPRGTTPTGAAPAVGGRRFLQQSQEASPDGRADTKLRSNDDKLNSPQILYSQPYERHLSLFECDLV